GGVEGGRAAGGAGAVSGGRGTGRPKPCADTADQNGPSVAPERGSRSAGATRGRAWEMERLRVSGRWWAQGMVWAGILLGLLFGCGTAQMVPYEQRLEQTLGLMQQGAWQQAMEAIGELQGGSAMPPALGRLWFVRGTLAQKLLNPELARQAFERVWQGYPPLADYAAWEMAQYDAAHDLLPALQKLVITLAERYPFSRLLPESQLLLARTQHRLGQSATARATLERLLGATAEHPLRPDMMTLLGQVYEAPGELALAAQTLQRLGESYPRDRQAAAALRHSRELSAQLTEAQWPQPDPEQLLASLDRLAEGQLWQEIDARLA